jgi:hypothetical protein
LSPAEDLTPYIVDTAIPTPVPHSAKASA